MTLDESLRFAIDHKRLIELTYLDARRVVEPHDYGVQKGEAKVLIYQRQSSRGRDSAESWRSLTVAKIQALRVLDETFPGSRGDAHQRHQVWDVLYARVSP